MPLNLSTQKSKRIEVPHPSRPRLPFHSRCLPQRRRPAPPPPLSAPPLPTRTDNPHHPAAFRCPRRHHHSHLAAAHANAIHDATAHLSIPQRRRRLSSCCHLRLNSCRYHELPTSFRLNKVWLPPHPLHPPDRHHHVRACPSGGARVRGGGW
jgi:hypothetical protein